MDVLHCPTKFVWEWVAFSALVHSAAIECMPAVTSIGPVHLAAKEWLQFPLFTQLWMECLSLAPIAQTDSTANDCLLWLSLPQFTQLWLTTTSALFCPHSRRCDCLGLPLTQFTQLWMSTFSCLYSPCSGRCECYLWPPFPDLLTLSASALSCLHCLSSLICEWVLPKMEGSCVNDGWHGARNCTTNVCSHKFVSPFYWVNSVLAEEITHTLRTHTKKCCMLIYLVLHLHIMYICTLTDDRFLNWIILLGYV